jgi:hypothetical protein
VEARGEAGDMKNRKTLVRNAMIPDQRLKDFILEVVNAPDRQVDGSDDHLAQKYRQFFPTRAPDIQLVGEMLSRLENPNHPASNDPFDQKEAGEMLCRGVICGLRNGLRAVWRAEYDDVAEWRIFMLQLQVHSRTNFEDQRSRNLYPPSPETPLELAVDWVRKHLLMLRICRNPECTRPFFVAHRAQQRFCLECVSASQKAHKRRWWRKKKRLQEEPEMEAGARIVLRKRPGSASRVSERSLKTFLQDIVNAGEDNFDYILGVYAKTGFLPLKTISERAFAAFQRSELIPKDSIAKELPLRIHQERREALRTLREGLRSIWSADDGYTAPWRLFTLQNRIYRSGDPTKYDLGEEFPPPADRIVHQAFGFLRQNFHFLRTCGNPGCKTSPLFIADKGKQAYCSDLCGRWGQQKAKAHWWEVEGPGWRKKKRRQEKKGRRIPRKTR